MSMKEVHVPMMEYRRDVSGNYLLLRGYTDDYRVHMLEHNRIQGLLRVSLDEDDGRQDIHYDIGSLESLKTIFGAQKLNGDDVSRIIGDIFRTVREIGAYMLSKDDILLDPEYMYVDGKDNLMLCYVPDNVIGMGTGLSELLRSMLAAVDNNDHDSVVLAYSLYQESLRENYVIDDLMKIIRSAGERVSGKKMQDADYARNMQNMPDTQNARDIWNLQDIPDIQDMYPDMHEEEMQYRPVTYDRAMEEASQSRLRVAQPEEEGILGLSRKKIGKRLSRGKKLFRME
jgi:hypothetical protein